MPAGRRRDSKHVLKVHYSLDTIHRTDYVRTRCGKHVLAKHATYDPSEVTCLTCRLIWDIPPGEFDEYDVEE